MPASNSKAMEKAKSLACDVVILDLEDAVAPDAKPEARGMAATALKAGGFAHRELVVRVNGLDTPWGEDDLKAAVAAHPHAILVPKVNSARDIVRYQDRIADRGIALWAMIETTQALFNLKEIAAASEETRLSGFVLGTNDFAKETGIRNTPGRAPFWAALSLSIAAARSRQLTILDGVYNAIEDLSGLSAECEQARDFGFDGKTLIHPSQIEACNAAFTPSDREVLDARAIVDVFAHPENVDKGVVRLNGKMVERLHLDQAMKALAIADAIALA
jgi:citrate lyase subunit beta/citryl-CoA lyase